MLKHFTSKTVQSGKNMVMDGRSIRDNLSTVHISNAYLLPSSMLQMQSKLCLWSYKYLCSTCTSHLIVKHDSAQCGFAIYLPSATSKQFATLQKPKFFVGVTPRYPTRNHVPINTQKEMDVERTSTGA